MTFLLWLGALVAAKPPVSPGIWFMAYARVAACALLDRTECLTEPNLLA